MSGKEKYTNLKKPKVHLEEHEVSNRQLKDYKLRVTFMFNKKTLLDLRLEDALFGGVNMVKGCSQI